MASSVAPHALPAGVPPTLGPVLIDHEGGPAAMTVVGCPAQPVGYVCTSRLKSLRPGPTCPLGHAMTRKRQPF